MQIMHFYTSFLEIIFLNQLKTLSTKLTEILNFDLNIFLFRSFF